MGKKKVRVAIIGVGNCASSLVQGVHYYKDATNDETVPGLMHVTLGGYHISDIEFTMGIDVNITKVGKDLWTMATYTCVRNSMQGVEKILFLAIDTTEQKEQSLDYEGQIQAINQSSIKVEYAPSGRMLDCNQKFIDVLGYSTEDLKEYSVFNFMGEDE